MRTQPSRGGVTWRVPPRLPAVKLAGGMFLPLAAVALARADPVAVAVAVAAGVLLVGWGVRDLVIPVRLSADTQGITVVTGVARRRLAWSQVERIDVDTRPRLGLRTETLEIDTGDALHLFGAYDLGVPPAEAAATLRVVRDGSP